MKETMLQKALKEAVDRRSWVITDEHIEVALAWIKGDITAKQAAVGLGLVLNQGNYQRHLAQILREAYRRNKITIKL